ncbi:hypothetical protein HDV05_005211 [Chytridiales sp. JEL 0842]|nr:hypothetical protein HDV05_005211 [Chytridiales sp. JEL 0842]
MANLDDLRVTYNKFCAFGSNRNLSEYSDVQMDGAKFAKFARDTGIIDNKKITTTDIDIIFNKVKPKGARKIDFSAFTAALQMLAEMKYPKKEPQEALHATLIDVCIKSNGPVAKGTTAQNDAILTRLTDTSLYTGTHKERFDAEGKGKGMAGRDYGSKTDRLDKIVNRDTNATIGISTATFGSGVILSGSNSGSNSSMNKGRGKYVAGASNERLTGKDFLPKKPAVASDFSHKTQQETTSNNTKKKDTKMATIEDLRVTFNKFCAFGSGSAAENAGMEGSKFAKFARDSGLIDSKKITTTDIDIIFNKVKAKTARKIDFDGFTNAFRMLAEMKYPKKTPEEAFQAALEEVVKSSGPVAKGTTAQNDAILNRLTDTSQYTGTHKERFDADGKGKGLAGRDPGPQTDTLDKIVNRETNPTVGLSSKNGITAKSTSSVTKKSTTNVSSAAPASKLNDLTAKSVSNSKAKLAGTSSVSNSTAKLAKTGSKASIASKSGSKILTDSKRQLNA